MSKPQAFHHGFPNAFYSVHYNESCILKQLPRKLSLPTVGFSDGYSAILKHSCDSNFLTVIFNAGDLTFGIITCFDRTGRAPENRQKVEDAVINELIERSRAVGMPLRLVGDPLECTAAEDQASQVDMSTKLASLYDLGARIVVVLLASTDCYAFVKANADGLFGLTQCMMQSTVAKFMIQQNKLKTYIDNCMLKICVKLSGMPYTLVSRLSAELQQQARSSGPIFQDPPASLCWVLDKPCMLVGIDLSHPEPGAGKESVSAVVMKSNLFDSFTN